MNKGINPLSIEQISFKENQTMTYYRLVIKYGGQQQFEIVKDFDSVEELKTWCLDYHPNAEKIGYMELN